MDLKKFDVLAKANKGVEIQLLHPVLHTPLGIFLTVIGIDSDEYRAGMAERNQARITRNTRGGVFRPTPMSMPEIEAEAIELLAVCTKAWRDADAKVLAGQIMINEVCYPCNPANAALLYTTYPWAKEQVDAEIGNRANFIAG